MDQDLVGTVVYYTSYGTPKGEYLPEKRAAIITAVENEKEEVVSVCVMNPTGFFFNQHVKRGGEGGQWDFRPHPEVKYTSLEGVGYTPGTTV